jgi:hypothetical protein
MPTTPPDRPEYNAAIRKIPMPDRIKRLPLTATGYPVPWFAAWIDNVPDLRCVRPNGIKIAYERKICWVCGEPLGRNFAMTLGPMCAVNRTISEPPSHRECSIYSAQACPFLSNPRMRRNARDLPEHETAPGNGILRNPGAICVWVTRGFKPFSANDGSGTLFTFDDPSETLWFAEGRSATRDEVCRSIDSGFPLLIDEARREGPDALKALYRMRDEAMQYLPAA